MKRERKRQHKKAPPSVGIIDSESVKNAHTSSFETGYNAGKKINGRKRDIIPDTLGCLWAVMVHGANVQD